MTMNPSNVVKLLLERFPLTKCSESISNIETKLASDIAGMNLTPVTCRFCI